MVAEGPRGPCGQASIWGNLSKAGEGHRALVHSVDCFDRHVFPKQGKKYTKRGALSHGSVHRDIGNLIPFTYRPQLAALFRPAVGFT